jgi:hypothetical protein
MEDDDVSEGDILDMVTRRALVDRILAVYDDTQTQERDKLPQPYGVAESPHCMTKEEEDEFFDMLMNDYEEESSDEEERSDEERSEERSDDLDACITRITRTAREEFEHSLLYAEQDVFDAMCVKYNVNP